MRRIPTVVFALVLVASIAFLHWRRNEVLDSFSLARAVSFDKASLAILAPGDGQTPPSYFVVYDANKRVAQVATDGALLRLLNSKSTPDAGFYLANDIAVANDGTIYIASTYINPDTLTVNRECVVSYDSKGAYIGIVFSYNHAEAKQVDNSGLIHSLLATRDGVQFCMLTDDAVLTYAFTRTGELQKATRSPFPDAKVVVQSATVSADGSRIAFTTATAEIFACPADGEPKVVFDGRETGDTQFSIPGKVRINGPDIFFSDLGRDGFAQLLPNNRSRMIFDKERAHTAGYPDRFYECKSFQVVSPDRLVFNNNGKIVDFNGLTNSSVVLSQADWGPVVWGIRAMYWLMLALATLAAVLLLRRLVQSADDAGRQMFKQMLLVLCMVAIAAGTAVGMVYSNMSDRLNELSKSSLREYLELGNQLIDGDAVERVNHVRHYRNEDYRNLLSQLRRTITRDGELQAGTYSGIYKVFGNKVTALAYHDGLRGIFYPYDYDYRASVYASVQEEGKVYIGVMVDQYGAWQIGVTPILNRQGKCVGMLEVGRDMSARKEADRQLLTRTVISISMILFVVVFIFLEIGFLNSHVFGHIRDTGEAGMQLYDEGVLRFTSYLALSAVFLPVSFFPVFCKSLAPPAGALPVDVLIGLPMVIETLCGAGVAIIYGHIHHRLGLKIDVVLACLVTAAGMAITSQTETYSWLIVGRVVVGMGMGLLMIAFRTYFLIDSDSARRESGVVALTAGVVAGINTGSVSGGMLATRFGERAVFMLQAELLVLAALFALVMLRNRRRQPKRADAQTLTMRGFLASREVWGFFWFAFLPVTACGMFLGFFFPLFAESRGCTEAEISMAFMLFGLCGVYLGPSLTKITTETFGAGRAVFVGALAMACGLLFFAYAQTLTAAYVTVLLFGLTDSFIFSQGLSYLSSRQAVARFGEDKAMGVYNVFESGGEAVGPIMFGLAMSFSLATGVGIIAALLTLSASIFLVVSKPSKEPPC